MSIATSLTDRLSGSRQTLRDVRHLFAFRAATVRGKARRRVRILLAFFVLVTIGFAVVPAFVPYAADYDADVKISAFDVLLLLPTAYAGFLVLAATAAIASGGGRELVARDQAVAFPISPAVDHVGALVMAPLNIAWILQLWLLLGASAFAHGPAGLPYGITTTLIWVFFATAAAQVLAWSMELVRRGPRGLLVSRSLMMGVLLLAGWAIATDRLSTFLDQLPLSRLVADVAGAAVAFNWIWTWHVLVVLALGVAAVAVGVLPARAALRRQPRDEARLETGSYPARRAPRSDFWALVRVDRASIWRSVPLRRGVVVLAALPGAVAFGGDLEWQMMTMLPGLVASGAALLFGINAWCLDGRGALWRDALPADPSTVFAARTWVLLELLLGASALTVVIAGMRAGAPSAPELAAIVCTWLVVSLQVVNGSMRWSISHPFAVDLRSARATPAPPLSMVGYSARLAWITTVTGLIFSGLALAPRWELCLFFALPMATWSLWRLARVEKQWLEPVTRSRVIATVAA